MAACAPTGAIGDLGTVHHRANFLPGHPVPWIESRQHIQQPGPRSQSPDPVARVNQATRHGWAYFSPGGATPPSAPSAARYVVAPPVEGAYLAWDIAKDLESARPALMAFRIAPGHLSVSCS
jgi:hypothetical protein